MKRRIGIDDRARLSFRGAFEFPKFYYSEDYKEKRPKDPNKHWKMFDLFNGAMFFYRTKEDTEDKLKETLVNLSKIVGGALWNIKESVGAEVGIET